MKSQMPARVARRSFDWRMAIVMRAMYEYGGFWCWLFFFSSDFIAEIFFGFIAEIFLGSISAEIVQGSGAQVRSRAWWALNLVTILN